jgi:IS5 family transposase
MGHVLMENRHGLVVEAELTRAAGFAERLAALELVAGRAGARPVTLGADRAYDTRNFVVELRELGVTPHVARNTTGRRSAIDQRTTRHVGYRLSPRTRHRIEEVFAGVKTIAGQRKTRYRGLERVRWSFTLAAAAYNLIRLPKLLGALP